MGLSLLKLARLAINSSSEPVSNVVVSTVEDGLLVFVLYLIIMYPIIATFVILILLALTV